MGGCGREKKVREVTAKRRDISTQERYEVQTIGMLRERVDNET